MLATKFQSWVWWVHTLQFFFIQYCTIIYIFVDTDRDIFKHFSTTGIR